MISCPKCNESLGDDIKLCPFCRYEFTVEDLLLIEKAKQEEAREQSRAESERTEKFDALRLFFVIVSVGLGALILISSFILLSLELEMASVVVSVCGMILLILFSVFMLIFKKANNCPHCGRYLYQNWGTNCQWCGKRIM